MSTRLVKKQLDACLRNPQDVKQASKSFKKRRTKKLHKQAAELLDVDADKTALESYRTNLKYFKLAKGTQKSTMELMQTVLMVAFKRTPLLLVTQGSPAEQMNQITTDLLQMFYSQLTQQQHSTTTGATLAVRNLLYHPPGAEQPLLNDVTFTLPANKMGLLIGRSGSGKTTLLQVLAGFAQQSSGDILLLQSPVAAGNATEGGQTSAQSTLMEERMRQVGLVFQFPERHFLGEDVLQELTFAWPRTYPERQQLSMRLPQVLTAVGMSEVPIELPPSSLSGGQQRRLALATQLVRQPSLLLLDEPLAGLDWKARAEVADMLRRLKGACTVLVVSHDLQELEPLVDCAWRMLPGGRLEASAWPLPKED